MKNNHENSVGRPTVGPTTVDSLLLRHLPALRSYVRQSSGQAMRARESSQDLVQAVCRDVIEDRGRFDYRGDSAFQHWLFTTAQCTVKNRARYYRAQRRDITREEDDGLSRSTHADHLTPSRIIIGREELAGVEQLLDSLSEEQREVILLSRVDGLSHAEIGRRMGRSEVAARQLLCRAMARITALRRSRPTADIGRQS